MVPGIGAIHDLRDNIHTRANCAGVPLFRTAHYRTTATRGILCNRASGVTSGKITLDSKVRVVHEGIVITEDEIASLKRFKDDAKEVAEGYECGVTLEKYADVKEGDVYEAFKMEEYRD